MHSSTTAAWRTAVPALYDRAQAVLRHPRHTPLSSAERQRLFVHYEERARQLGLQYAEHLAHPCHTLAHRLLRFNGNSSRSSAPPTSMLTTIWLSGACAPS